jgi:serine/threonine protein kinase
MSSKSDDSNDNDQSSTWQHIDYDDIKIGEIIGGGGVGVIYKGIFKRKEVAIKTFFDPRRVDEKVRQDFLDELMVMSKLKHSNIVDLVGACTEPNLFFVMELCEASLFQILHVDKVRFSDKESFQVCIDVGCAMEYLHALSPVVIHRSVRNSVAYKSGIVTNLLCLIYVCVL